jgi:hypothetical protein
MPLAIAVTIACFLAAVLALIRLGLPFAPLPGVRPHTFLPALALLVPSGGTLMFSKRTSNTTGIRNPASMALAGLAAILQ